MYSVNTRTCAVTIFKSLLAAINQNITNKDEKAKLLNPVLPVFINKLIDALGKPSGKHTSFALKTEIIKGRMPLTDFSERILIYFIDFFAFSVNLHG